MIRPATCLAMLLAAGAGLYLYQAKHQAYVLDRQIDQVVSGTAKVRARISVLKAEYALLNDPSRLQELAAAHLPTLAPLAPGQFTTLAQLDGRLPPVGAPPAPPAPLDVSSSQPGSEVVGVTTGHAPYDYPPAPAVLVSVHPLVASVIAAPAHTPPRRARPASYASAARSLPHRVATAAAAPRPDPLSIPAAAPPIAIRPSQVASALGMARSLGAPAPAAFYQRYQPGAAETLAR